MQPSIFGLINHPHAAAAKFLDDAVVRYGLPDHGRILRANQHQVNESEGFKGVQRGSGGSQRLKRMIGVTIAMTLSENCLLLLARNEGVIHFFVRRMPLRYPNIL